MLHAFLFFVNFLIVVYAPWWGYPLLGIQLVVSLVKLGRQRVEDLKHEEWAKQRRHQQWVDEWNKDHNTSYGRMLRAREKKMSDADSSCRWL